MVRKRCVEIDANKKKQGSRVAVLFNEMEVKYNKLIISGK